jgi:aldose 1-epimerase
MGLTLSLDDSTAEVSLEGAHVGRVILDGEDVVKQSSDGVPTHGGIAVLIPYAGRVRQGKYSFEGTEYSLPLGREGHAIHGFAKDKRWEVVEEEEKKKTAAVKLRARIEGQGFPATLAAEIEYTIGRTSFSTRCVVENTSRHYDCPLMVGFHPYFLARDWTLKATGRAYRYTLADQYFPTGEKEECDLRALGPATSLDDVFKVSGAVTLSDSSRRLTITRKNMPYVVLFNGKKYAEGRSLAIEPYTGLPDAYNNGIGLVTVKAGGRFACGYEFSLSRPNKRSERDFDKGLDYPTPRGTEKRVAKTTCFNKVEAGWGRPCQPTKNNRLSIC